MGDDWERVVSWSQGRTGSIDDVSDEALAFALTMISGSIDSNAQRDAVKAVIDLRNSKRQMEQAKALIAAVEQLKSTESSLDKATDRFAQLFPLLERAMTAIGAAVS